MFNAKLTAHLAELSKLEFTEDELNAITKEMDDIIALMDTVSDFDAANVFHATQSVEIDHFRADNEAPSMERQKILENAKKKEDTFFTVPKVV